jgi:hypothetical protein
VRDGKSRISLDERHPPRRPGWTPAPAHRHNVAEARTRVAAARGMPVLTRRGSARTRARIDRSGTGRLAWGSFRVAWREGILLGLFATPVSAARRVVPVQRSVLCDRLLRSPATRCQTARPRAHRLPSLSRAAISASCLPVAAAGRPCQSAVGATVLCKPGGCLRLMQAWPTPGAEQIRQSSSKNPSSSPAQHARLPQSLDEQCSRARCATQSTPLRRTRL